MWLFRASPYASVRVGRYLESMLSDIPRHPHPRLPGGRLKSRKYKKSAFGGKKNPAAPVQKEDYLVIYRWHHINGITQVAIPAVVTPSANRNSYRVAPPYYIYTQGRVAVSLNPGL